jgi:hypothetical protein
LRRQSGLVTRAGRRCDLEAPSGVHRGCHRPLPQHTDGAAFNASRAPTSRTRLTVRMNALEDPATAGRHQGSIPVSAAEGVEARHLPACPTPELRRHYIASSARAVTSIVADYRATAGMRCAGAGETLKANAAGFTLVPRSIAVISASRPAGVADAQPQRRPGRLLSRSQRGWA